MLKKYGWKKNPFDPSHPDPEFLIYKQQTEDIIEKIKENRLLWVNAPMGAGKTTVLRYISKYGHKHGLYVFYWHYGSNPKVDDFKQAAQTLYPGFFEKHIFGCKTRVVLIDEANYIKEDNFYRYLVGLLDDPKIFPSLVFASVTEPPEEILFKTFKDRPLETMNIKTSDDEEILGMVEKRIKKAGGKGLVAPFDRETVLSIIKTSDTPRAVLEKLLMLASGKISKIERRIEEASTPLPIREVMVKSSEGLDFLSAQQRKIVELLFNGPLLLDEIAKKINVKKSSVRVQLYRLASAKFLKDKGCRRPIVEKSGDIWRIHKEYKVAEQERLKPHLVIRPVKKEEENAEDFVLKILKEGNAVSSDSSMKLGVLEIKIRENKGFSDVDVKKILDNLCDQGKVVLLDEKVFLV